MYFTNNFMKDTGPFLQCILIPENNWFQKNCAVIRGQSDLKKVEANFEPYTVHICDCVICHCCLGGITKVYNVLQSYNLIHNLGVYAAF